MDSHVEVEMDDEDPMEKYENPSAFFRTEDPIYMYAVDGRRLACFFSGRCWLSNFYTSTFEVDGNKYTSVEQYYQYCKAIEFKDYEVAQKILSEGHYDHYPPNC
jgi:predicted NAD-dependent protein-ADP-ribosyltransferase YbiA (DUF1768 family)